MKFRFLAAAAALWGAATAGAGAQQQPSADSPAQRMKDLEQRFQQLDKNGDGRITTDEVPLSPFFKQRDSNGDNVITLAEAKAALEGTAPAGSPKNTLAPAAPAPRAGSTASPNVTPPNAAAAKKSAHVAKPRSRSSANWRHGPQPLPPNQHGVGRLVADVAFKDLAGKTHRLSEFPDHRAIVVAMTSTSCPMSRKYLPTLAHLAATFADRPVAWVFVNAIPVDRPEDMRRSADFLGEGAIYVRDADGEVAKAVGALTTTDVVILDRSRTVLFHGAVDDQYGIGYSTDQPKRQYVADALEAILAGKGPAIAATEAPGCALDLGEGPPVPGDITFHNRVSRIMQANCVECHRAGGVGPFSLVTYEEVAGHAGMIKQVLQLGTMPPWFAAADSEGHDKAHSPWANDRSLSEADIADLLAWIEGGKQPGDARDAAQPHTYNKGWLIGKPDVIFEFPRAVPVKATGTMPYENVIVETNLDSDQWVQAIEVQPGDRSVVHHMLIYLLSPDRDGVTPQEEAEDERNGFWAIYVPGNSTLAYPEGFARMLPQGVKLRCQVHYAPSGMATSDRSRIGVVFARQPPRHEVRVVGIGNPHISIPPGAENHREEGSLKLPMDIQILSFLPHMHLRSKACRYRVVSPSGDSRTLLDIPRYDFEWQLLYRYREPRRVLQGETIKFTGWFDNSKNNPANPDPTATVRWGKQINDEMHLGYVEYFVPGLAPGEPLPVGRPGR